jgi:hypothetical protein
MLDDPPKNWLTFSGKHGVISQKIELIITTASRTSNPTFIAMFFPHLLLGSPV